MNASTVDQHIWWPMAVTPAVLTGNSHGASSRARLLIADDHTLVAEAARTFSNRSLKSRVSSTTDELFFDWRPSSKPEVVILDIAMPHS
jgi:ActR/RegA family two-component response regulator